MTMRTLVSPLHSDGVSTSLGIHITCVANVQFGSQNHYEDDVSHLH